ncbi:hypothetical protein ABT301_37155 [Streptomyces sp. NPDC000987]|uniref:hypothetical protein n=1 Tax=Streptomyces sp. NPDC000987 TaxID=3154374 RepID=UPI0033202691
MHKIGTVVAALGLAALGLAVPATAQAATTGANCDAKWPGRDGYVRAWDGTDCSGTYLGGTQGNDSAWGDTSGAFQGYDENRASSVMNSGYTGGYDVVAFYFYAGYTGGYGCLSPYEYYVDDLSRNTFTSGYNMNNNIMSHKWVPSSACSSGSWMS